VSDQRKIAANLQRFREAVFAHDRENPTHTSWGVGLSRFDLDRLGFEDGEELWPGMVVRVDGGPSGMCRVLCDGQHTADRDREAEESKQLTQAVSA
jgi:hypothetical protein